MKTTKWTKWQLGVIGAVGIAFLFREIKDSPNFAFAAQQHQPQDKTLAVQGEQQDPVMQEWRNQSRSRANDSGSNSDSAKRHGRSNRSDTGNLGGSSSSSPEAATPGYRMQTRTGRS
ncbi:hypothetical protein [Paenibacillus elgii]|uniref:hypothetical protein n=1 Tax=Paenibacillus elgii TaxID=189691 RepID=UPI00203DDF17|nr:hypothetical protein [Paenibacillus elgii]MCM3267537.1 hypothetical protein [Paenibacillus elgii]